MDTTQHSNKGDISRRRFLKQSAGAGAVFAVSPHPSRAFAAPASNPSQEKDRVTLLLITGWATHNIGDIGHTPGTLRYLEEHFPEAHVICWMHAFNAEILSMLRQRFPDVELVEGGDIDENGEASTPELQAAFDEADFVIQNSGMSYNRFWAPPVRWAKASLEHGKHFGHYGQSFDGFREEDRDTTPDLLSNLDFIFCRDNESLLCLRSAGVTTPILEFGPDGCFGVDVRDEAAAEEFMDTHQLEPRKFLAVILRTDKYEDLDPDDPLQDVPGGPEEWSAKLREVMEHWVRGTGLPVVIVPEVEKEIEPAKELLLERLPEDVQSKVVHRETFWNVDEAVSFYARAHALVSVEPHSCIMALAAGTPAIHFFTRHHGYKAWMFRDIGLPEWLISLDDEPPERVISALERIRDTYALAQRKAERAMDFVHARSAEMIGDIKRIAQEG
ncbi:MAG: polysaccharide pyruvyl transferase family protein [Candidatus Hydrogenedentota bacterium]